MAINTGTNFVPLDPILSYDSRTGDSITNRWHGTPSAMADIFLQERAKGRRVEFEPVDGNYYRVFCKLGAQETQSPDVPVAVTWELVGNDLEKNKWLNPKIAAQLDKIEDIHLRAVFRRNVEDYVNGEFETITADGGTIECNMGLFDDWADGNGLDKTILKLFFESRTKGADSFLVSQYVLKRTMTVTSASSIKPAYINIDRPHTRATLIAVEQPETWLADVLPEGEYLKKTPTLTQISSDKKQIAQEWWHADQWDRFDYGDPL